MSFHDETDKFDVTAWNEARARLGPRLTRCAAGRRGLVTMHLCGGGLLARLLVLGVL